MTSVNRQRGCLRWAAIPMVLFGLVQALGGINALRTPPDATDLLPYTTAIVGWVSIAWAVIAIVLAVVLFRQRRRVWHWCAWYIVAVTVSRILFQLSWAVADYERQRIPFLLTTSLLILMIPLIYLAWHYVWRGHTNGD